MVLVVPHDQRTATSATIVTRSTEWDYGGKNGGDWLGRSRCYCLTGYVVVYWMAYQPHNKSQRRAIGNCRCLRAIGSDSSSKVPALGPLPGQYQRCIVGAQRAMHEN